MLPGTLERTPIGIVEQSQQGTVCTSAPHTAQLWNNLIQEKNKHTKKTSFDKPPLPTEKHLSEGCTLVAVTSKSSDFLVSTPKCVTWLLSGNRNLLNT